MNKVTPTLDWSPANRSLIESLIAEVEAFRRVGRKTDAVRCHQRLSELRAGMTQAFLAKRGWIIARTGFTLGQLREGRPGRLPHENRIDPNRMGCIQQFRHSAPPFPPAGILIHDEASPGTLIGLATLEDLAITIHPWSWIDPESCIAALLTRR